MLTGLIHGSFADGLGKQQGCPRYGLDRHQGFVIIVDNIAVVGIVVCGAERWIENGFPTLKIVIQVQEQGQARDNGRFVT
eukprot:scaffold1171_cov177-Amphora_coffeaeformis.AAC.20